MVAGLGTRSGPINLFVHGKSHYEEDLSLSVLPLISRFLSGVFQCALSFMSSQFSNIFLCKKKKKHLNLTKTFEMLFRCDIK